MRSFLHCERFQTYFLLTYSLYASYQCLSALSCLDFLFVQVKLPLHNDFVFNIGLGFRPVLGLFCLLFCALPGSVTLGSCVQRCCCTVVRCLLVVWTSFGLLVPRAYCVHALRTAGYVRGGHLVSTSCLICSIEHLPSRYTSSFTLGTRWASTLGSFDKVSVLLHRGQPRLVLCSTRSIAEGLKLHTATFGCVC